MHRNMLIKISFRDSFKASLQFYCPEICMRALSAYACACMCGWVFISIFVVEIIHVYCVQNESVTVSTFCHSR